MDVKEIQQILTRECKISGKRPLIVGVSGGADSLCLVSLLASLKLNIIVTHFDHKLRSESGQDAQFVASIAHELSCRFVLGEADVHEFARVEKLSLEAAARRARYTFLFEQARNFEAEAVAVGHTADDQVETILLHLLRGSGLDGLKGMSYRTRLDSFSTEIPLIRPLLGFWREDTVAYCTKIGLVPIEDKTNQDRRFQRNRVRSELIPILETYNPQAKKRLWTLAQVAQTSLSGSAELSQWIYQTCLVDEKPGGYVSLDGQNVSGLPEEGLQTLLRLAVRRIQPETTELGYQSIRRAVDLLHNRGQTGQVDLGSNLELVRVHGRIYIHPSGEPLPHGDWPRFSSNTSLQLTIPGITDLAEGWAICAEVSSIERGQKISKSADEAWLDYDSAGQTLFVKRWQPGDHLQPLGMTGTIKLSDFFINQKIPSLARKDWPVVCRGDEIVWVASLRISEKYRLTPESRQAIHLQLIRN